MDELTEIQIWLLRMARKGQIAGRENVPDGAIEDFQVLTRNELIRWCSGGGYLPTTKGKDVLRRRDAAKPETAR